MATPQQPEPVLVTVGNFVRAESDRTLAGMVKMGGSAGSITPGNRCRWTSR
jgi:hypothetical protein